MFYVSCKGCGDNMSKMLKIASIKKRIRQLKKFAADDKFSNNNGGTFYPWWLVNTLGGTTALADTGYLIDRLAHPTPQAHDAAHDAERAANRAREAAEQEIAEAGRAAGEAFDARRRNAPFGDLDGDGVTPNNYRGILSRGRDYYEGLGDPHGPLPRRSLLRVGEYDFLEAQNALLNPNITPQERLMAWAISNRYIQQHARLGYEEPGIELRPDQNSLLARWTTGRSLDENESLRRFGRPTVDEIPADVLDRELSELARINMGLTGEQGTRGRLPFAENGHIVWDTPENIRQRRVEAAEDAVRQRQSRRTEAPDIHVENNTTLGTPPPTFNSRLKRTAIPILWQVPGIAAAAMGLHNTSLGDSSAEKLPDWAVNLPPPPPDTTSTNTPSVKP